MRVPLILFPKLETIELIPIVVFRIKAETFKCNYPAF